MNCIKNGSTEVNFLTPSPGSTEDSATYLLQLQHRTCGNKQMCLNNIDDLVASGLSVQALGEPELIGDGNYCLHIRCVCDLTYQQVCGNACCPNYCLQTEKCIATTCVPLTSAEAPEITANGVIVAPVAISCGRNTTNTCTLDVSFTVEQPAAATTNT